MDATPKKTGAARALAASAEEARAVRAMLRGVAPAGLDALLDALLSAKRVFAGGAGRSLLVARAFAMRLAQLGLAVFVAGDVTTPAIGAGDLFFAVSSSGTTASVLLLARRAAQSGARVACLTQEAASPLARASQIVAVLPRAGAPGPDAPPEAAFARGNLLGSFPEAAALILLDGIVCALMLERGLDGGEMARRHANLE